MNPPAKTWSVQSARAHFGEVIEGALSGKPQRVTRRGKKAVVVVAEDEWKELAKPASELNLGEFLATFPLSPNEFGFTDVRSPLLMMKIDYVCGGHRRDLRDVSGQGSASLRHSGLASRGRKGNVPEGREIPFACARR